jgi:hypothetical protein
MYPRPNQSNFGFNFVLLLIISDLKSGFYATQFPLCIRAFGIFGSTYQCFFSLIIAIEQLVGVGLSSRDEFFFGVFPVLFYP